METGTGYVREKYGYGYGYGGRKIFQNKVRVRRRVRTFFGFRSKERVRAEITLGIQVRNGDGYGKFYNLKYGDGFHTRLRTPGYGLGTERHYFLRLEQNAN